MRKLVAKSSVFVSGLLVSCVLYAATAQSAQKNKKCTTITQENGKHSIFTTSNKCAYAHGRISFGPYLYQDRSYDGSELLSNAPKLHETAYLLGQYAKIYQECGLLGVPMPVYPRISFSGFVEGSWSYSHDFANDVESGLQFSGAEFISYLQATHWLSAFVAANYDTKVTSGVRIDLFRAYVILGDLTQSPIYTSFGQMYVPFGEESSLMEVSPATVFLGRINALTWVAGYQQLGDNALHAETFGYRGDSKTINGGGDLGYNFKLGKVGGAVGGSYVSNLADSAGIQSNNFSGVNAQPKYRIPAFDVYSKLTYQKFIWIGEYVQALKHFATQDVGFENHGAEPAAWHTELGYLFKTLSHPSSVGVGYDQTYQSLGLGLPEHDVTAVYNISVVRNSNLGVQYTHGWNYPVSAATTGQSTTGLGKQSNQVLAVFDYYF